MLNSLARERLDLAAQAVEDCVVEAQRLSYRRLRRKRPSAQQTAHAADSVTRLIRREVRHAQ